MVGGIIVRIVSSLLKTVVSWNVPEKKRRVDNASVSDICRKGIVSCGGHFDRGGGKLVKNRCGYHVTLKRVRLY